MPEPRAIVYDVDGVLVASPELAESRIETLAIHNNLPFTAEVRANIRGSLGQLGARSLQTLFSISEEHARQMYHDWESMDLTHPAAYYDGVHTTLHQARRRGVLQFILTSRSRRTLVPLLNHGGLSENDFDLVVAHEDTLFHKPDGRAFDDIIYHVAHYQIRKEEILFVGDSAADSGAGKAAGITTVLVRTGAYESIRPTPTHCHVIKSIAHLPDWLGWH